MASSETLTCPFCGFKSGNDYQMLLHVETLHSEDGDSPFIVKDQNAIPSTASTSRRAVALPGSGTSTPSVRDYVECPYRCGEQVQESELQFHIDFHVAEEMDSDDTAIDISSSFSTDINKSIRNVEKSRSESTGRHRSEKKTDQSWKSILFLSPQKQHPRQGSETKLRDEKLCRLGKAELGPYANERRMPTWLVNLLEEGAKVTITNTIGSTGKLVRVEHVANETPNLVLILATLSMLDSKVSRAFYCSRYVDHVAKLPREGGFCGYRNIQMLISYIRNAKALGHQRFEGKRLPSILKLQDMIEHAWDRGFNESGRAETGGIRMTRKYIGTPEAQALLLSLDIATEASAFVSDKKQSAYLTLLTAVREYFDDEGTDSTEKVVLTDKPPLYFQHRGHSMTIVGVEMNERGVPNLVVFDPMYNPSSQLRKLALDGTVNFTTAHPGRLLRPHRRDERYLSRYKAFEVLKVNGPA